MSKTCVECGAKCCTYFCFEIDEPTDYGEFEDVRWFLLHQDVTVHIDGGDWFISICNRCKMLGLDNRCGAYDTRPNICRTYDAASCDHSGGDYQYEEHFTTPEQLEAYARRMLGDVKFDRARAKVWGLKTKSKKKNKRKKKNKGGKKDKGDK